MLNFGLTSAKVTAEMNRTIATTLLMMCVVVLHGQMTITLSSTPQLTPLLDDIYIAGNFNDWNPADPLYKLNEADGQYSIEIAGNENDVIEFKFTRGSWATVEGNEQGNYINNRSATWMNGAIADFGISGWEDIPDNHTTTPTVYILDGDMYMPQLDRVRRIWIKLPEGYHNSDEEYPVIYMHDGQNLFDVATSFAGEWTIDEITDDIISENCIKSIVVGIDNGGISRTDEYSPWLNTEYNAGGEGSAYAAFVAETLKPLIDSLFRTRPERESTFVGGSSLGALISAYLIIAYPDDFGGAILMSPAFWFNSEIQEMAVNSNIQNTRIHFACGNNESSTMVSEINTMIEALINTGVLASNIQTHFEPTGQHNEYWWAQYFEDAYEFVLNCSTNSSSTDAMDIHLYPNPVKDKFTLGIEGSMNAEVVVFDKSGKEVLREKINAAQAIDISNLSHGVYTVEITLNKNPQQSTQKITRKVIKF